MTKALVLNATFEPLCVVSMQRAVVLLLDEKAELVHRREQVLRSQYRLIPVPSVVRLMHYVRVPRRRRMTPSRRAVFLRDDHMCQYCGAMAENIDHVIPRSKGGLHVWENVVAACRHCNATKENRTPAEAGLRLRRFPAQPRSDMLIAAIVGSIHPHWLDYLVPPLEIAAQSRAS